MKDAALLLVEVRDNALVFGMCGGMDKTSLELLAAHVLRRVAAQGADVQEVMRRYEAMEHRPVRERQVAVPLIVRGNNG